MQWPRAVDPVAGLCGRSAALHYAAKHARTDVTAALIFAGADVAARNLRGCGAHRGMVCARSPTCVRTRRMTAEDKARERGASVEYAEAVRKVMPVPRAPAPVEAVELVGWDRAASACGLHGRVRHCTRLGAGSRRRQLAAPPVFMCDARLGP